MKKAHDFPKIYLYRPPTDMRKQGLGLAKLTEEIMDKKPFSGSLFLFCNRRRDIIKALCFDKAGFCVWCKKLDQNRFPWPGKESGTVSISAKDFDLIIDGVDVFKRHEKLIFESIS